MGPIDDPLAEPLEAGAAAEVDQLVGPERRS